MSNISGISPPQNGDGSGAAYVTKISDSLTAITNHTHASSLGLPVKRLHASTADNVTIAIVSNVAQIKDGSITNAYTTFGQGLPVGSMVEYVGTSAPTGWLLCDGSTVSRTTYANLYSIIGNAFGNGDGSTTFTLPNMKGMFARGHDNSKALDPDRASRTASGTGGNTGDNVGSKQMNAIATHAHVMTAFAGDYRAGSGAGAIDVEGGSDYSVTNDRAAIFAYSGSNTQTNPKNVYFNYMVKH